MMPPQRVVVLVVVVVQAQEGVAVVPLGEGVELRMVPVVPLAAAVTTTLGGVVVMLEPPVLLGDTGEPLVPRMVVQEVIGVVGEVGVMATCLPREGMVTGTKQDTR
jgi:hypothetical protein